MNIDKRNSKGYMRKMIKSFKHKGLEDFFYTGNKKGINPDHAKRLSRILDRLNAANEMKLPAASGRGIKDEKYLIILGGTRSFPPKPLFRVLTPPQADGVFKRA